MHKPIQDISARPRSTSPSKTHQPVQDTSVFPTPISLFDQHPMDLSNLLAWHVIPMPVSLLHYTHKGSHMYYAICIIRGTIDDPRDFLYHYILLAFQFDYLKNFGTYHWVQDFIIIEEYWNLVDQENKQVSLK